MTTNVRNFLYIVATLALIGGIVLLATPVSSVTSGDMTVSCGTAWAPDTYQAGLDQFGAAVGNAFQGRSYASNAYDGYAASCDSAISTRRVWGYAIGIIGLLLGAGVAVAANRRPEDAASPADGAPAS
ncbi:hypothetical protein [Amycolatopsis sp. NBC_00438]|uniref:hypothetical protein n=1 Tax=Amycolatopsis sp. NBC_00438 TaxID=2903558 RepID=UPI002E1F20AF